MRHTPRLIAVWSLAIVLLIATLTTLGTTSTFSAPGRETLVYGDALANGWEDWSWNSTRNLANTTPVFRGNRSIAFTPTEAFAGLSFRTGTPLATTTITAISFYINGNTAGDTYVVYTQPTDEGTSSPNYEFRTRPTAAREWQRIVVPLSRLGNPAQIARINIMENGDPKGTIYVDEVKIIGSGTPGVPGPAVADSRAVGGPASVAFAPDGRVYVAAYPESKVYSWASSAAMLDDAAPDLTLGVNGAGQSNGDPDNNGCGAPTAQLLCGPEGVVVDSSGNLYVADTYYHRVLIYFNPATDATPTTADRVLGQTNFTSSATNVDVIPNNNKREGYFFPRGVAVDFADNLYVVDEFNQRVLRYDWPLWSAANDPELIAPDAVLGQANLNTLGTGTSDSNATTTDKFRLPLGVAVDGVGNVYVADIWNNRVQRFDYPLTDGEAAAQVYTGFLNPHDVGVDPTGTLFVSDTKRGKVEIYLNPLDNATSDGSISGLQFPMGLAFDAAHNLYVADCGKPVGGNVDDFPPCRMNPRAVVKYAAPAAATPTNTSTPTITATPSSTSTPTITATPSSTSTPTVTTSATTPTPTRTTVASDIQMVVNAGTNRKPINPDIYGLHYTTEALANELDLPVRRWGGNDTTRYNYQFDISNSGYDYYFVNSKIRDLSADQWIERDRRTDTKTIMTMPMTGWVSKNDPDACGFDVDIYDYTPLPYPYNSRPAIDPERGHCGSGIVSYRNNDQDQPVFFSGNNPTDTSVAAGPAFVTGWIQYLTNKYGTAANGGIGMYSLDNEPDLWNSSHRDVHPAAVTYDELRDRSVQYATTIKNADGGAATLGPVSFGWSGYFYSAFDLEQAALNGYTSFPDREAHGDVPLVAWYLQQMRTASQTAGKRLLDYFDLHFYPQNGVDLSGAGDAANQALRLRSTRALWDPTYRDESWIGSEDQEPEMRYVRLIPRMREWIAANYPGTKIAITEYNWGALDHINGALAQADILGIFGREGVDLATMFDSIYGEEGKFTPTSPGAFAFRMYRNYDGAGSKFGDVSVQSTSTDQGRLAIYSAQQGSNGVLTLMVINKTGNTLRGAVQVNGFNAATTADVFRYSPVNLNAIERLPGVAVGSGQIATDFAANSITLLRLRPNAPPQGDENVYLPLVLR